MDKQRMNRDALIYEIQIRYEEIYKNVKLAIELSEEGEQETAVDILKAVCREVGGE